MAARRPIVNFAPFDSEASTIINERQLGWNFDPNSESENEMFELFKEVIIKYKSGSLREPLTNKYLKDFSTEVQTKSIETLIE